MNTKITKKAQLFADVHHDLDIERETTLLIQPDDDEKELFVRLFRTIGRDPQHSAIETKEANGIVAHISGYFVSVASHVSGSTNTAASGAAHVCASDDGVSAVK